MILLDFDYRLFTFFNSLAGKSQAQDFFYVFLADYVMFLMFAGLALFLLLGRESRTRAMIALQALIAAFIGRALIVTLIRIFFFRPRPFVSAVVTQLISQNPLEGSFPSGHAAVMFSLAFSLAFTNWKLGLVYFLLAVASGLGRIIAGVHYPLDIVGGLLVGAIAAFIAKWLADFWLMRKRRRAPTRQ